MKHFVATLFVLVPFCLGAQPDKPNILWITNEDTSPSWGCYGDAYASTPNIDALAAKGIRFERAYSNAPICAPARSTLITGLYATTLGTQHLRSEIPVPDSLEILPELLRKEGYYTTNNAKTDYNFESIDRWDENGQTAHWRNRPPNTPFFSVFNFGITHEGNTNSLNTSLTEALDQLHDPALATLPPYFPQTENYRELWAHAYDLVSTFDLEVGRLLEALKADGELENTIIFVFSDHGWGLPRHKRWLYNSGLRVPFVMHVPDKFGHLVADLEAVEDRMVGFVDFVPTVLELAGATAPAHLQGQSFLEIHEKPLIFSYRDRADDCYDMSRAVSNGRYMYIRNFMPHLPYIQDAVIFNRGKAGYEELFRVRENGSLPRPAEEMFLPKPTEELYDLEQDPWQLNNLSGNPEYDNTKDSLRNILHEWMIRTRDTGLINEGIMMELAGHAGTSVLEMARDTAFFDPRSALKEAEKVGLTDDPSTLSFASPDPILRFWALVALENMPANTEAANWLKAMRNDTSPVIAAYAERLLIERYHDETAYEALKKGLKSENEPVVLQVAIEVRKLGKAARPLLPYIRQEIYPAYQGTIWGRYKSWSYPMFIGMALDQSMINCGEDIVISN